MPTTITKSSIKRVPITADVGRGVSTISVVVGLSFDGNNHPVWSFNPDPVTMAPGRDTINFTLNTTTGCLFDRDDPFQPLTARGAAFTPTVDATGTVLTVIDVNTVAQGQSPSSIGYCVAVKSATGTRYVSDPTIVNDPPDPPGLG